MQVGFRVKAGFRWQVRVSRQASAAFCLCCASHLPLIFSYESRLRSVNLSAAVSAAATEKIYLSKPAGHRHEKINKREVLRHDGS